MENFINTSKSILKSTLDVKEGESVLIVTDDEKLEIGNFLYEAAKELNTDAILMVMKKREVSGQEPPKAVAEAMKNADVVLCPTTSSLTHTNAKIEAAKAGSRIATMPGITKEMFIKGAMTADYSKVEALTKKVTDMLTNAKTAKIEKEGLVLNINIEGRNGVNSSGVYRNKGEAGNLPSGEGYIAPLEDGSNGEVIIDGSMVKMGVLSKPLKLTIKNGKLIKIENDPENKLAILLANEKNATLCELGIGTNESAILCGIILEDEKVFGTVHIAFGTNTSFGGTNKADCHLDGIILKPTLFLDDKKILDNGNFLL